MDEFANGVIRNFPPGEKKYIFDVGANNGEQFRQWWPNDDLEFHLFEPTPSLAEMIRHKSSHRNNVHVIEYAVGDMNGFAKFNIAENGGGGCSSLQEFNPEALVAWVNPEFV